MSRPAAPKMPTAEQIKRAFEVANQLHPGARILTIGPDGVTFEYPSGPTSKKDWEGKPLSGRAM